MAWPKPVYSPRNPGWAEIPVTRSAHPSAAPRHSTTWLTSPPTGIPSPRRRFPGQLLPRRVEAGLPGRHSQSRDGFPAPPDGAGIAQAWPTSPKPGRYLNACRVGISAQPGQHLRQAALPGHVPAGTRTPPIDRFRSDRSWPDRSYATKMSACFHAATSTEDQAAEIFQAGMRIDAQIRAKDKEARTRTDHPCPTWLQCNTIGE